MEIVNDYPPIYGAIVKRFPSVAMMTNVVFTYGDKLYAPGLTRDAISDDLLVHEKTHTAQQSSGVEEWWSQYLTNDDFRLSQELEAYNAQYLFIKDKRGNRIASYYLADFTRALCSEMYGFNLEIGRAEKLIKKNARKV